MKNYTLENDIKVMYVQAETFPDGIQKAFDTLDSKLVNIEGIIYYGISYLDDGKIVYKAGVEERFGGEADKLDVKTLTIKKGEYLTETILDWRENMSAFSAVFQKLLDTPKLDRNSFCVEWYKSDTEVMCMVKLME